MLIPGSIILTYLSMLLFKVEKKRVNYLVIFVLFYGILALIYFIFIIRPEI